MSVTAVFFFESPAGSPGMATWPNGTVPVSVRAKVENPGVETVTIVPRLYRGTSRAVNTPYDTGTLYDPPVSVTPQTLTESWANYTWDVPVQELTGPVTDRFFMAVVGSCANFGPTIHVGGDGGANQTMVATLLARVAAQPASLLRNPDSARPSQTASAAYNNNTVALGTFKSRAGDPGMAVWRAHSWRLRIWAQYSGTGAPPTILASLGRRASGGGYTSLASGIEVALTTAGMLLYRKDVAVAESSGSEDDVIELGLNVTSTGSGTVTMAVGLDNPSSINAPLIAPPGGTPTAPTDDHKVSVDGIATPQYLANAVQSDDGSVDFSVAGTRLNARANRRTPIADATIAADGSLDIGAAETLVVDPAMRELSMIQTPPLGPGQTAFRRLIFTAATKMHNAVTPLAGYSALKLGRGGTPKDTIVSGAAYALAEFTYVPSVDLWVLGAMNTT